MISSFPIQLCPSTLGPTTEAQEFTVNLISKASRNRPHRQMDAQALEYWVESVGLVTSTRAGEMMT